MCLTGENRPDPAGRGRGQERLVHNTRNGQHVRQLELKITNKEAAVMRSAVNTYRPAILMSNDIRRRSMPLPSPPLPPFSNASSFDSLFLFKSNVKASLLIRRKRRFF